MPLQSISTVVYDMQTEKLQRRNQFRTVTISAFAQAGTAAIGSTDAAMPRLREFEQRLPPGYRMEIGGEREEQVKGFRSLSIVMMISIAMIYLALVFQFHHAIKPLIVFAAHSLRHRRRARGAVVDGHRHSASWRFSASPA